MECIDQSSLWHDKVRVTVLPSTKYCKIYWFRSFHWMLQSAKLTQYIQLDDLVQSISSAKWSYPHSVMSQWIMLFVKSFESCPTVHINPIPLHFLLTLWIFMFHLDADNKLFWINVSHLRKSLHDSIEINIHD